ncbi:MAG: PTS sugar transporter subunit IIC [Erysipelotrichaceae bacterium]|nr:PTS sugar transporter subunit IIC [Erysipelotrichaceae bacterium]
MLGYAIVIGLLCWLVSSAFPMWLRWSCYFGAPLVSGLVMGLLFNNLSYGLEVGATIQMAYIGLLAIGGSLPNELAIAGYLGVAMTMIAGLDASTGLAVATPLGLLGVLAQNAKMSLNPIWVHKADKYAAEGNIKGIKMMNLFASQIFPFITYFIPAFICVYFGAAYFESFMNAVPVQVLNILKLIGKMMPALGLAMLMQALNKRTTLPFLIIGFVAAAYLGMDTTSIALVGAALAILHYFYMKKGQEE